MPLSAAASAKKRINGLAGLRIRVQFKGVYTRDIATRIGQRLELLGKDRDESGEPVGETVDHSKCLVPFKTLAGMLGLGGECVYLARTNSDEAQKLLMLMAAKIFPMNYELKAPLSTLPELELDVGTKDKVAILALLCGRSLSDYDDAMAKAATAKQLLEELLSQLPEHTQQPEQTNEAAQPEQTATHAEDAQLEQTNELAQPEQTNEAAQPEQTNEAAQPEQTNEAEKGDTLMETDLGELGELDKLPPLHDEMLTEQASPETQRSGGADDAPAKAEDEHDEETSDQEPQDPAQDQPQDPAQDQPQAPAQAERAANKRPRQTGEYQAKSKRKKQQMSTFFVVGRRKTSKSAAAQKRRADAKEKLKRSAKFKLIGRVPNDAAQQLPAAERTVEPVEPGYLLAPVQSVDYLFKYAIRDTTTGDAEARFFDKERLFARKLPGGRVFWPHIGLVNACMTPGKWCKRVADDNYCYYPTADEVAATVAVYGAAFNVLIHSSAATAPRSGSGSSSDSGSGSGSDSGSDSGSGDDSGNDE